jgi:hypothetical protein
MRNKLKLTLLVAVLMIGAGVLVFGKMYFIRNDSGGNLLWNGSEAYLFIDVRHRGFQIGYLEYPWIVAKELLYGVRAPDDQRTSVTVVHITASGVARNVVEASDEEQANTPDLYKHRSKAAFTRTTMDLSVNGPGTNSRRRPQRSSAD